MILTSSKIVCGSAALVAVVLIAVSPAVAQYQSKNVKLLAHMPLSTFGASHAFDCWGYVSDSGREYALIGLSNGTGFVEITDPANPVVVKHIALSNGGKDMKVYKHYVYVSHDRGPFQIIDVGEIDNGVVNVVTVIQMGTHNIAINEESGYLYLARGGPMVVMSLEDPVDPFSVGVWNSETHDAQIVSYHEGPYAGREIAFVYAGWSNNLDIVDVTNKSSMKLLSRTGYSGSGYTHQGWLTDDRRYLYMDDELDEINGDASTTRTLIWDVSDLAKPVLVNEVTNGLRATDHNQYYHKGFLHQANYKSGYRIWDASDPVNPVEVGFFDTYPPNDDNGYDAGAWNAYPFFPSGTVIVSDKTGGLFILDPSAATHNRPGDLNCDGSIDLSDVEWFVLAMLDANEYENKQPDCKIGNADINRDGSIDLTDVQGFIQLLLG